jgi:hypothetical protein
MPAHRLTIAVDFDGVIHSYTSPWTTVVEINDPPVEGAFEWLTEMVEHFDVFLFTCRLRTQDTEPHVDVDDIESAMRQWFYDHGLPAEVLKQIKFWRGEGKPHAYVYLDDRGMRFEGVFPSVEVLQSLKQWNRSVREEEE